MSTKTASSHAKSWPRSPVRTVGFSCDGEFLANAGEDLTMDIVSGSTPSDIGTSLILVYVALRIGSRTSKRASLSTRFLLPHRAIH